MSKKQVQQSADEPAAQTDAQNDATGEVRVVETVGTQAGDDQTKDGASVGEGEASPNAQEEKQEAGDQGVLPGVDDEAPFGRRSDGTPAAKRGPKPKSAIDERAKQTARLKSVTPSTARAKSPRPIEVTPMAVVNYQAMGESVATMFFHGGELILGPDWAPDTQAGEHLAVAGAFRDYFKAMNMRDLPPGFSLCFVLGVYSLKRATKPTVKSKLQSAGLWLKHNLRFKRS